VTHEPPLAHVQVPDSVPLAAEGTVCGDWRTALRADFADPGRIALQGAYPAACGVQHWSVAPADPEGFAARAIEGMWRELGGTLTGRVREGAVPPGLAPAFSASSPPLSEVVRDINKFSNNVMTRQLFLTLALQANGQGSLEGARALVGRWWDERTGLPGTLVLDNGAGLSREERVSARALARMLQRAWASPVMPELVASLPIAGVDGTLRRRPGKASGWAHLKTGTLRDVAALAGYVLGADGRRRVLVAIVNHPNAPAARPALDALVDWAHGAPHGGARHRPDW
ncbi:D-alanyl-D-alanine carboxypeptidase/D-alanyl-D-alanine-endopeptidase, partial [Melaminivora alkalimesophila]